MIRPLDPLVVNNYEIASVGGICMDDGGVACVDN